jgi:hypothetical protein
MSGNSAALLGTLDGVILGELSVESLSRGVDTNTASGNVTARGDVPGRVRSGRF